MSRPDPCPQAPWRHPENLGPTRNPTHSTLRAKPPTKAPRPTLLHHLLHQPNPPLPSIRPLPHPSQYNTAVNEVPRSKSKRPAQPWSLPRLLTLLPHLSARKLTLPTSTKPCRPTSCAPNSNASPNDAACFVSSSLASPPSCCSSVYWPSSLCGRATANYHSQKPPQPPLYPLKASPTPHQRKARFLWQLPPPPNPASPLPKNQKKLVNFKGYENDSSWELRKISPWKSGPIPRNGSSLSVSPLETIQPSASSSTRKR